MTFHPPEHLHVRTGLPRWERMYLRGCAWRLWVRVRRQSFPIDYVQSGALTVRYWNWCVNVSLGRRRFFVWHFVERAPRFSDYLL